MHAFTVKKPLVLAAQRSALSLWLRNPVLTVYDEYDPDQKDRKNFVVVQTLKVEGFLLDLIPSVPFLT
jgi:hypothetical protein